MNLFNISSIIQIFFSFATGIVGFVYWSRIKNSNWKWLPFYILFETITTITLAYFVNSSSPLRYYAVTVINERIAFPAGIIFFLFIFYKEFNNTRLAVLPFFGFAVYAVFFLYDIFFSMNRFGYPHFLSKMVGAVIVLIAVSIFLFKLASSNQVVYYRKNLGFWIGMGLIIRYFVVVPFGYILNVLLQENAYINGVSINTIIFYVDMVGCLTYLLFIEAFVCGSLKR